MNCSWKTAGFSAACPRTAEVINDLLSEYKFDAATRTLRDFVWNEFCDWYVEMVKPRLRDDDAKASTQRILVGVLDGIVRLLAPVHAVRHGRVMGAAE